MARGRLSGFVAALLSTAGLWWASTVPMPQASTDAVLRLAWSARPERVEDCRLQSEEALATLPPHMRQALICEGTTATYHLQVHRNSTVIDERIVRGGGMRQDRPLYVFRELRLPAGEADISVRMVRMDTASAPDGLASAESRTPSRAELQAVPALLTFERRLRFQPRQVILVTYDPDRRALVEVPRPAP